MFPIHFVIAPIRSEQLNPGVNCTKWSQISWYASPIFNHTLRFLHHWYQNWRKNCKVCWG